MAAETVQYHPPIITPVRRYSPLDFSISGLIFCSLMMFMGLAAINSQVNLLFAVLGLMFGVLLISGVIGRMGLRKLSVNRTLPEHGTVGAPITLGYEIQNRKRLWPSMSITLTELDGVEAFTKQPQAYLIHAGAGMKPRIATELLAKRRGLHRLGRFQLISSFPFGFIRRSVEGSQENTLLIYPAIGEVDEAILQKCRSAESTGSRMHPRPGGADEFYGVKEFREGENPRWIYWRRSARTGTLVAKEMTQVAPPRLLLLVDTQLPPGPEGQALVERTIAMAATLTSHAVDRGLPIGMIAWSNGWMHIPPRRGKRHRRDILTALAQLPANSGYDALRLLNESRRHRDAATTVVLLTPAHTPLESQSSTASGLVVLAAESPAMQEGFRFPKSVDFSRCDPVTEKG